MKKVVAIGGGTGLSTLLRGIRDYPLDISAIVTVTDDGASTGRLRKDLDIPAVGDIRKCIAALSTDETYLQELFEYRFGRGKGISGHSLGNLFLAATSEIQGSFEDGVKTISKLFKIKGEVIPATLENVHLVAEFDNKKKVIGESKITKYGYKHKIKRVYLSKKVKANPRAVRAIEIADFIIVGPGSLYTSILPNFLSSEISDALNYSIAPCVYIANVSSEKGETEGYTLKDHCEVLLNYNILLDLIVANNNKFKSIIKKNLVSTDIDIKNFGEANVVSTDLLNEENMLYHDHEKLGSLIWEMAGSLKKIKNGKFKI